MRGVLGWGLPTLSQGASGFAALPAAQMPRPGQQLGTAAPLGGETRASHQPRVLVPANQANASPSETRPIGTPQRACSAKPSDTPHSLARSTTMMLARLPTISRFPANVDKLAI